MGRACSTYGGEERYIHCFWWGNLRGGDRVQDPGISGRIILKWVFETWDGGIYWIDVA